MLLKATLVNWQQSDSSAPCLHNLEDLVVLFGKEEDRSKTGIYVEHQKASITGCDHVHWRPAAIFQALVTSLKPLVQRLAAGGVSK